MTPARSISKIFKFGQLERSEYAILKKELEKELLKPKSEDIFVDSISRVKGKEGEKCLFIISNALMPYFLAEKNDSIMMQSHLYVALTRSSQRLDILFLEEVEKKYSKKKLEELIDSIMR